MTAGRTDRVRKVLLFVEDPGAANFAVGMVPAMRDVATEILFYAEGKAVHHLCALGCVCEAPPDIARSRTDTWLRDLAPDWVVSGTAGNRHTLGLQLIAAARKLGIMTVGLVDAPSNLEHRFRGPTVDPLHHAPDLILAVDDAARLGYEALGYPKRYVAVCGNPHFDRVRALANTVPMNDRPKLRRKLLVDIETDRPLLVFVTEKSDRGKVDAYARDHVLNGRGGAVGWSRIVLEKVLDACAAIDPAPAVLVRLHPRDRAEDYASISGRLVGINQGGDPLSVVAAADLVVGIGSTLLTEAALLRRPTLAVLPSERNCSLPPSVAAGIIPAIWTHDDLATRLRHSLSGRLAVDWAKLSAAYPSGAGGSAVRAMLHRYAQLKETTRRIATA